MIPRTIDPLQFLRENYQQKNIKRVGDNLEFEGGIRLPLDAPTALINRQNKTQYTIGELYFFITNINKPLVNYYEQTQKEKINIIPGIDKDNINDYFKGVNDVENLDNELKTKTLIFMGKKKNDNDLKHSLKETNNLEHQSKKEFLKKKRLLELKNPNLAIMDYIYTNEKKSLNRNSMLKPPVNIQSYESLLSFCRKVFQKDGEGIKNTEKLSFLDELAITEGLNDKPKGIIIVPETYCEGNLCFENAKTFLDEAKYINVNMKNEEDKDKLVEDPKKNIFVHKICGKEVSFEICSNIRNFKRNDWKKVVAVFLNGEEWEFKGWPKGEDVISILQKVKGFHLKYKGLPINQNIKNWNVKVLEIHRTQRHYDITIQTNFWQIIEEFLKMPRIR